MTDKPNDLLLIAGKVLTIIIQIAMAIAGAVCLFVAPFVIIFQNKIFEEIQAEHAEVLTAFPAWPLAGLLLIVAVVTALTYLFFGKLRAIINTVSKGDPFEPENADRLNLMAWLLLGVQVLMIPIMGLGLLFAKWVDEIENSDFTVDAGLDIEGVLMVIVLFILARVFKHGARMREDLEGTV